MAVGARVRLISVEQRLHAILARGQPPETEHGITDRRPVNSACTTRYPVLNVHTEHLGRLRTVVHLEPRLASASRRYEDEKASLKRLASVAFRQRDLELERRLG